MNERNALSLPAITASQDGRRGGVLGLSAVSLHRLLLVIPALCGGRSAAESAPYAAAPIRAITDR
jgi:hypothetical protein